MRGRQDSQANMLAFIDVETRIPLDHPCWRQGSVIMTRQNCSTTVRQRGDVIVA
jgi:hypothetical protein